MYTMYYTSEGSVSISTCNWLFLNYRQQDFKYRNYYVHAQIKLQHVSLSINTGATFTLQPFSLFLSAPPFTHSSPLDWTYSKGNETEKKKSCILYATKPNGQGGWDMLIFQPHHPRIITNSWRPLHDLSHSKIILRKAWFPYQHVILKCP